MSAPFWVLTLADEFWRLAGEAPFPRDLRRPIARALPVTVCYLPHLRVAGVETWLARAGAPSCAHVTDRPLRACLIARGGHGLIFVDGDDDDDEQRFSLAHELAHFLRDYRAPRLAAVEALGPAVAGVLDGDRPARPEERIHAVLAGVPIGTYVHLMDRDGGRAVGREREAERAADRLAWELLAPQDDVAANLGPGDDPLELLRTRYGLPLSEARHYAAEMRADVPVRRLRLVR